MDPQHPDQLSFWHHVQQVLQQPPQLFYSSTEQSYSATTAQLNWLQNESYLLQLQQQQQQFMIAIPQLLYDLYQAPPPPPLPQQVQPQDMMPIVMPPMKPIYQSGTCAMILINFMHRQSLRPEDNNIEFWKDFVSEYFAPNGNKRSCFSVHESRKKKTTTSVSSTWQCDICNHNSGHGFETSFDALPMLFKVKYDGGILEDLLHVDKYTEYINSSGQVVLECSKVRRESLFEKFRVLHYGNLKIAFALSNMKICSWEFCVMDHEVFMIKGGLVPIINELGIVAQNCKALADNVEAGNNISLAELQNNCDMMVASTKILAETVEVPLHADFGYTKKYVRFLEMSQEANNIKDLIDFSIEKGIGPIESLMKFPKMGQQGQQLEMRSHDDLNGYYGNIEETGSNTTKSTY